MGLDLYELKENKGAILCHDGWAFGPVFQSDYEAEQFLEWLKATDGRRVNSLKDAELERKYSVFRTWFYCEECGDPRSDDPKDSWYQAFPSNKWYTSCQKPENHEVFNLAHSQEVLG